MRIVSLLPSATEIVCALGAADELVGISHECDYPPAIRGRPVLTQARIDVSGSSRSIDAAVRNVVADTLSIYTVDDQRLAALRPDVIVTQDLCEVCAVSLDDVRAAVARLMQRQEVQIVTLRATRLHDVLKDFERVAIAIGRLEEGRALCARLNARLDAISARAGAGVVERPRTVSLEWLDPLMLGGTWMPDLIEKAGGTPLGVMPGAPAATLAPDALAALEPQVVVVKPCGFSLQRALAEGALIDQLTAALDRSARIYVTDGNAYFNRPGPRLIESAEILAACIHPQTFADYAGKHRDVIVSLPRS